MIPATASRTSPAQTAASSEASAAGAAPAVDFQSFLRLLTAQLRYQDPLSPLQSTEFVSQLAGFSTVEQLVRANERLDAIAGGGAEGLERYAAWIGREAALATGAARFEGEPVELRIAPDAAADRVEAVISGASGDIARFAAANSSDRQYWDGTIPGGVASVGVYRIRIEYFIGGELLRSAPATTFDRIEEASAAGGDIRFRLASGLEAGIEDITGLRTAARP